MTTGDDNAARVRALEAAVTQLNARVASMERMAAAPAPAPARVQAAVEDFEHRVGAYWLSRLGIVALITGIAFLIIYRFGEPIPPGLPRDEAEERVHAAMNALNI